MTVFILCIIILPWTSCYQSIHEQGLCQSALVHKEKQEAKATKYRQYMQDFKHHCLKTETNSDPAIQL